MADMGLSTLGVRLFVAEAADGTKPTAGYTQLTRINSIGEASITSETIDASALEDKVSKFISGRSTVTDTIDIAVNLTNDTAEEWKAILGKQVCFMVDIPKLDEAYFIIATPPEVIPMSGQDQNNLEIATFSCTVNDYLGLGEKIIVE